MAVNRPDGAGAHHHCAVEQRKACLVQGPDHHRQGLHQGRHLIGQAVRHLEQHAFVDPLMVGHATVTIDADQAQVGADMRDAVATGVAVAAGDQRVGHHSVAHREARVRRCLLDAADEFVAQHQGRLGAGVLARVDADVGAADTAVAHANLDGAGPLGGLGYLGDLDLSGAGID